MLEIIENLRLFIETQGIGERMQVAMLVDESALRLALREKYNKYDALPISHDQLVEESVEKLFLVYLRLPTLSGDDLVEIADKYFNAVDAAQRDLLQLPVLSETVVATGEPKTVQVEIEHVPSAEKPHKVRTLRSGAFSGLTWALFPD